MLGRAASSVVPKGVPVTVNAVTCEENAVALLYHLEQDDETLPCSTTITFFVKINNGLVTPMFSVKKPKDLKPGNANCKR